MKLVKALNGDWVNVAHASSFNVADFGNRSVVFARVGNTSYELFQSPDIKAAESFLEDLFNKLGEVLSLPANEIKSVFLAHPGFEIGSGMITVTETLDIGPKKRAPRKPKDAA